MSESHNQIDMQRLRQLAREKCTGALTDAGVAELSELLAQSTEARDEYWQVIALHSQLNWDLRGPTLSGQVLTQLATDTATTATPAADSSEPRRSTWGQFALAASLLVAALGGMWMWSHNGQQPDGLQLAENSIPQPQTPPTLGTVSALLVDSTWSFGRPGGENGEEFRQGDTIWLSSGAVEFKLASQTKAVLESPAIMQLVSSDRVRMLQGGVKVEVAKGDEGFTVETSTAEVIDLGTVFSVNVADGNTDLVVFDGEVDLRLTDNGTLSEAAGESKTTRFRAGEAVQVARDGTLSRIVTVQQSNLASQQQAGIDPLIVAVSDNNVRDGFYSFYEIVPGGMREDAPAFVDRPHQWNGNRSTGMPAYLSNGDYVKTFNDDKVVEGLNVELTVARPATLYVLLDKRVTPPEWLLESFEDTGDEIGVDEVPYYPEDPFRLDADQLSVGPGRSINRTHSIWKRVVHQAGIVSLGANGPMTDEAPEGPYSKANMYGIVAVPLAEEN